MTWPCYDRGCRRADGYLRVGKAWWICRCSPTRLRLCAVETRKCRQRRAQVFARPRNRRLSRRGERFGLLRVDLDGFKLINDTQGHGVGDELLRQVADRLRAASTGPGMFVSLLAGDEFAYIVPHVDADQAMKLAPSERRGDHCRPTSQ